MEGAVVELSCSREDCVGNSAMWTKHTVLDVDGHIVVLLVTVLVYCELVVDLVDDRGEVWEGLPGLDLADIAQKA